MNAKEIITRLIDSKAINGEEAMCLTNAMSPKLDRISRELKKDRKE